MERNATAVVFESPGSLSLRDVGLPAMAAGDCVVDVEWTGISTGTERLLWDGRMPHFPGLAYPLVPGYETVGIVTDVTPDCGLTAGQRVFIPGSRGFTDVHGLFGGAAGRLVVPGSKAIPLETHLQSEAVLLALSATACRILSQFPAGSGPDLIIGYGVLGRLLTRICHATFGTSPTVWETNPARRDDPNNQTAIDPLDDEHRQYQRICDVSGSKDALNNAIQHAAAGAQIVLGGFYAQPVTFEFPAAFMREINIKISAEWQAEDIATAQQLITTKALSLSGLVTHDLPARAAQSAYETAFNDPTCLKMVLDWRSL